MKNSNNKPTGTQRLVKLSVLTFDCKKVEGDDLAALVKEESVLGAGGELTKEQLATRVARGQIIAYKNSIEGILGVPQDPSKGADYSEMAKVMPLIRRLKDAEHGDELLLDKEDFDLVNERVKSNRYPMVSEAIYQFIEDIGNSKVVEVTVAASKDLPDDCDVAGPA